MDVETEIVDLSIMVEVETSTLKKLEGCDTRYLSIKTSQ